MDEQLKGERTITRKIDLFMKITILHALACPRGQLSRFTSINLFIIVAASIFMSACTKEWGWLYLHRNAASGGGFQSVTEMSKAEIVEKFGPATRDYKVPGNERYEVVTFKPLFKNWGDRMFLFKDGRYVEQASGQYPVRARAMENGEVHIVKTGESLGPPIGEPHPHG